MDNLVKDLDDLLEKYGIDIGQAIQIYKSHHKLHEDKQESEVRLVQYHEDSNNIWCYYDGDENNPCGCGSNCFHYEYDRKENKIYGVCNACGTDIYEVKDEYMDEKMKQGVWLSKIDINYT